MQNRTAHPRPSAPDGVGDWLAERYWPTSALSEAAAVVARRFDVWAADAKRIAAAVTTLAQTIREATR